MRSPRRSNVGKRVGSGNIFGKRNVWAKRHGVKPKNRGRLYKEYGYSFKESYDAETDFLMHELGVPKSKAREIARKNLAIWGIVESKK